jgi:NAD(P)-dependent dehydrogenase (short-subunit alcohol dehydrogenase family)
MAITFPPQYTVIVTGAASGIGEAIAEAFLRSGATVFGADRNPVGSHLTASDRFHTEQLDVTDDAGWATLIDRAAATQGRIDCLTNVAGMLASGSIEDVDAGSLMQMLEVNTKSVFTACREAIRVMKAQAHEASIINIASANAVKAQSWTSAYAASKAAVLSLTRTTALHCAEQRYNIRVNAIMPGIVNTQMVQRLVSQSPDPQAAMADLSSHHPNGRLLEASEIASVATFLASPLASGITGAGIAVDCGMTAG